MIKDIVSKELDLIKDNKGFDKEIVHDNENKDFIKLIEIILSECKYSVLDEHGNYARYGSSTDIRIAKMLIKMFLTNVTEIPPEIVSMALTKENILGPFTKINFEKKYNEIEQIYDINMEQIFPNEFNVGILKNNESIREKFTEKILVPYVKEIILENDTLCSKYPVGCFINKRIFEKKDINKMNKDLIEILKHAINIEDIFLKNISSYILVNIMSNKHFKNELIKRTENVSELQKLGKIHTGFNSMVNSMVCEVLQMLELKSFPYGELASIKSTFYSVMSVLFVLAQDINNCSEHEILNVLNTINRNCSFKHRNVSEFKYRSSNNDVYKFGEPMKIVNSEDIEKSLIKLCSDIKKLIEQKNNYSIEEYTKEAFRLHYRFLRISPYESANGRTARALVNLLLKEKDILSIFKKETRKEYFQAINEINKLIGNCDEEYLNNLSISNEMCLELENKNVDFNIPCLLINS